jgi:hypothetical protein
MFHNSHFKDLKWTRAQGHSTTLEDTGASSALGLGSSSKIAAAWNWLARCGIQGLEMDTGNVSSERHDKR